MAISKEKIDLKMINRDFDLAENNIFTSDPAYRRRNAKEVFDAGNTGKTEDPKGGPLAFTDVADSAMCLQPYAGKFNKFEDSPYAGKRNYSYSSDQDGSSILISTECSVYTGWLGYAMWMKSTCQSPNYNIYVGCIGRHWAELPENTDFKIHYKLGNSGNNKGKPQCEIHGYVDGPAAGSHKMFGYHTSATQKNVTLGPYNCGTNRFIMFTTACFVAGDGNISGYPTTLEHQFLNIWLEVL